MPVFDYLAQHPRRAAQFSESMVGIHGGEPPAVAAAYDFSAFGTIVDVGGATGNMLAHILTRHPQPSGVLFDRPHVVTERRRCCARTASTDRVTIEHGNFFESVPGGRRRLHPVAHHPRLERGAVPDTILGNCRKAMKPGAKLLIVEFVLPEGNTPHFGKLADMVMLTIPGGEERTAAEYRHAAATAGFKMTRVVPDRVRRQHRRGRARVGRRAIDQSGAISITASRSRPPASPMIVEWPGGRATNPVHSGGELRRAGELDEEHAAADRHAGRIWIRCPCHRH